VNETPPRLLSALALSLKSYAHSAGVHDTHRGVFRAIGGPRQHRMNWRNRIIQDTRIHKRCGGKGVEQMLKPMNCERRGRVEGRRLSLNVMAARLNDQAC
jgi:hypothetical protein